jgi:predicted nucleic acid-binding protein
LKRLVDASVALKWVFPEDDSAAALQLAQSDLHAPDLLAVELANALWKKVQRGQIDRLNAAAAFVEAMELVDLKPTAALHERALAIALELDHPVYDCVYLALAESEQTRLVTADVRLIRKCEGTPFATMVEALA